MALTVNLHSEFDRMSPDLAQLADSKAVDRGVCGGECARAARTHAIGKNPDTCSLNPERSDQPDRI